MNAGQRGAGPWGNTTVHAAGSLRAAFTVLGDRFEREFRCQLTLCFAAAGLLKDRLQAGEASSLFASANLDHPQSLVAAGLGRTVQTFARNRLCLLARPGFEGHREGLAARLLDLPTPWAVEARYGLTMLEIQPAGGEAFAAMLLAGPGQAVLRAHGLCAP